MPTPAYPRGRRPRRPPPIPEDPERPQAAGPVRIRRADGTEEIRPAYTGAEIEELNRPAHARRRQGRRPGTPSAPDPRATEQAPAPDEGPDHNIR